MPIGRLMKKIQCQLADLDQPAAQDRAGDRAEQHRHAEHGHHPADPVPGRRRWVMIVMPSGISMPPPRPCSTRKAISGLDVPGQATGDRAER